MDADELLLPEAAFLKPPGNAEMLRVIAYDVASARRLRKVSRACEDFGVRVQKSVFECWLEPREFLQLWDELSKIINPDEDSLVAYTLDTGAARDRMALGNSMRFTDRTERYVL